IKTEGLDATGRERIVREAQAMGRLGAHPHIVTIFEIGPSPEPALSLSKGSGQATSDAPYVVTELMGGGDVEGLLKQADGALPLARTLEIAKDVARGLVFAHDKGVVHRDLKPGNVWPTDTGVAKIGDFGLAVSLDRSRLTQHGMMVGTVAYMPPEQALGGETTPQADLYSLGAMLYEMVTGKPPFQADDPTAVISQHINTPPVAPSWNSDRCPPDLEQLILRLLAKVPADRPGSAAEVLAALERVDPDATSASHSDSQANPLDRLARGVFVGRERELERLRSAFDNAFAGHGSVVMLVGEPGIGKTRTTQELETYARMRGAKVFWGRAHEASGAPPYWPWVQVGRAYRDQTPEETRRREWQPYALELQRIFPALRDLFPGLPPPPPADSEEAQFALFDAWSSFIRAVAAETPLLIVLDDAHWADRATLRMLTHLSRDIDRARLLVLGTYRDTDLDRSHPLSEALAEMNREQLFSRVLLRGLSEEETAGYIRATANVQPSAELAHRIHVETEGNPFFLSEVVRLMAEEGALTSTSLSGIAIPEGVKEALGRRLDRLSPEANELLSVAAVVGRECSHALLSALVDFDEDTLLRLIEEALRARVIEETGVAGEYRFTHALMQDALYTELSTARRVRMHGRVAEAIEALYAASLDGYAAQLARHFGEAAVMNRSLAEKAVRYAELAALQAESVSAWDEAAKWYREALAGLEGLPADFAREGTLRISLCLSLRAAGLRGDGWTAFHQAVAALRRATDARLFAAQLVRSLDPLVIPPEIEPLKDVLREALSGLGEDPSADACHLLAASAASDYSTAGDAPAERARAMAKALGLTGTAWPWRVDQREQFVRQLRGDIDGAVRLGERRHAELVAAGLPPSSLLAITPLWMALVALGTSGETGRQEEMARRTLALAQEGHNPGMQTEPRSALARIALARNERAQFDTYVRENPSCFNLARIATYDAIVRADVPEASRILPPRDHPRRPVGEPTLLSLEIHVLMAKGGGPEAERLFEEWRQFLDRSGFAPVRAVAELGECLFALGDRALFERSYRLLEDSRWFRNAPFSGEQGDVMRGLLVLRLGDVDAAERHYAEGLEWARRPDVRYGLVEGRCRQGLAEVAERRGEQALAMEHLDAAAAKFAEYGAKFYLDQVLAKKQILKA
ncbi:MAG: AAA family ATPase, partial [Dehalococcoidia bacterium]